jgi:hypothetical protein
MVELFLYSFITLHGVVLNYLSTETTFTSQKVKHSEDRVVPLKGFGLRGGSVAKQGPSHSTKCKIHVKKRSLFDTASTPPSGCISI